MTLEIYTLPVQPKVAESCSKGWLSWCRENSRAALPAAPATLAGYLEEASIEGENTFFPEIIAAVVSGAHRQAGHPDPVYSPEAARTLAALAGAKAKTVAVPNPLGLRCINAAILAAQQTQSGEERNEALSAALIMLMTRETNLLTWELPRVTYADIRRSGNHAWLTTNASEEPQPVSALLAETAALLAGDDPSRRMFPVEPNRVTARLKRLTANVGLGTGYSFRSGSMGLLLDIMVSDPAMPVDESERKSDPGFRRRGRALFQQVQKAPLRRQAP